MQRQQWEINSGLTILGSSIISQLLMVLQRHLLKGYGQRKHSLVLQLHFDNNLTPSDNFVLKGQETAKHQSSSLSIDRSKREIVGVVGWRWRRGHDGDVGRNERRLSNESEEWCGCGNETDGQSMKWRQLWLEKCRSGGHGAKGRSGSGWSDGTTWRHDQDAWNRCDRKGK